MLPRRSFSAGFGDAEEDSSRNTYTHKRRSLPESAVSTRIAPIMDQSLRSASSHRRKSSLETHVASSSLQETPLSRHSESHSRRPFLERFSSYVENASDARNSDRSSSSKKSSPASREKIRNHRYSPYSHESRNEHRARDGRSPEDFTRSKRKSLDENEDERRNEKAIKRAKTEDLPPVPFMSLPKSERIRLAFSDGCLFTKHASKVFTRSRTENAHDIRDTYSTPKNSTPLSSRARSLADRTPYPYSDESPSSSASMKSRFYPKKHLPFYDPKEIMHMETGVGFIDSHCHLDFLFQRVSHYGSYRDYMKKEKVNYPASYEGCIAVFCDPLTFAKRSLWRPLIEEENVWGAFGCHPHKAVYFDNFCRDALISALEHDNAVALGEIGLDYSNRNCCPKHIQKEVFRDQLKIALEKGLPLVIHCRDAYDDCLKIMKEMVPLNYKIHLHCFTDSWFIAEKWLKTFQCLFIGLTNLVTFPSATEVHELVKMIPLDRLLIETDSPYFLPKAVPRHLKWSHPGMAIHVAAQVAAIKQDSIQEILMQVRINTKTVYGI